MTEAWFDPNSYAWIPGTAYGVIAGGLGGLVGVLLPKGRATRFLVRAWFALWALAVALLLVGLVALANGQPWGVWFGFLLPGVIGTLVVGANSVVILATRKKVEQRRLAAKDLM